MNIVMIRKAMNDLRWTASWYALGLSLYGLIMAGFYPSMGKGEAYQQILKVWPKALLHAFGIADFGTFAGFMGGEFLNLIWPLIAAAFLITAGTAVVAQEVERGTIELWLSIPLPRWELLSSKLIALLGGIGILIFGTVMAMAVGARLVNESITVGGLTALALELLGFSMAVAGYSALFSALSSSRGKAAGVASGLTVASYLAFVVSGLSDRWNWLEHLSTFAAYQPQRALVTGTVDVTALAALLSVGLISALAALIVFSRRNAIG